MSTRTPAFTTGTRTPFNTTGTRTPFKTTDAISFEEQNPHCMLMLSSSCDFMLPKRRFWKDEQKMTSGFSTDFSMVHSPNLVLTPLKSASFEILISSFVAPSRLRHIVMLSSRLMRCRPARPLTRLARTRHLTRLMRFHSKKLKFWKNTIIISCSLSSSLCSPEGKCRFSKHFSRARVLDFGH